MADFLLFQAGNGGASGNRIYPSSVSTTDPPVGYSDHQRRRSYQVTRQLTMAALGPQGGVNINVSQDDWLWYQDYLAGGGTDVQVGDYLDLIFLPKNTRLEFVYAWVLAATTVAGLTFDLVRRTVAGVDTAIAGVTGLGAVAANPTTTARLDVDIPNTSVGSYLAAKITAVPASGQALAGLSVLVTAEVVDWGSFDFNGNA